MGESVKHAHLVSIIKDEVGKIIPKDTSRFLLSDSHEDQIVKEVPINIYGSRPDVYYELNDLLILGEAKTNDWNSDHSKKQYSNYIDYCASFDGKAYFVVAVPWVFYASVKDLVTNIAKKKNANINLLFIDDVSPLIKNNQIKNNQKMQLKEEMSYLPTHDAFLYQKKAVDAIKDLEYAAVFHEQGLGKTKIAIDILLYWLENKMLDVVLIVTKKILVSNWVGELEEHANLKPAILTNDKKENYFVFNGINRVILTNFETLLTEKKRFDLYLDILNVGIIVDESAKLKNPESKLTQCFFEFRERFKKRIIMTGTPVSNRPYDIWSQIYFLDGGKSLGNNFTEFKEKCDLTNDLYKNEKKSSEFEDEVSKIYSKISSFSVRETKNSGIISLPDKVYHLEYAEFEKEQLQMYNSVKNDLQVLIEKDEKSIIDDSSASLKRLLRLVQVASNPLLLDDTYIQVSGKELVLDRIINEILDRNEKAIIWTSFIDNVNYFHKKYRKVESVKIHGSMSIDARVKSVQRFKNDSNVRLLFATPQAAKEGLTLTVANNVIFYDRTFSLDDYLQAQDRIHRISQEHICNIYNIILENSIDEWVDVLLKAKEESAHLAQGDIGIDDYKSSIDYSFGEMIKDILSGGNDEQDKDEN